MLLLDWWPLHRFQPSLHNPRPSIPLRLLWEKVPFIAAGLLSGLVSLYGQKAIGALGNALQFPMGDRLANALISNARYLAQTLWPAGLAAHYPYPSSFPAWSILGAALLLVTVSSLALWGARRWPYLAVGWLWYVVTLLPPFS